jgi:hypothetical protein
MGDTADHLPHDLGYLLVARQALVDAVPDEAWVHRVDDSWCHLQPRGHGRRVRGWEIHLSATPESAPDVLVRAAAVLGRQRTAFRFAKDPLHLRELLAARGGRGAGGWFLTAYPDDRDQVQPLADDLHRATTGLTGPPLPPDRAHRPGSLVHCRST